MSLPSRKDLLEMKRPDLQRLCKDYGVRANLKTESLIELLLDTTKKANPRAPPSQTRRSVSTRQASRSAPRISSVIIHDTDDEDAEGEGDEEEEIENKPEPEPEPVPAATRSRKAKETQLRLGVGRPVQAGGSGPRAVTRSASVAKGKRGKNSRAIKPVEETIQEEEEEQPSQAGPSQLPAPAEPVNPTPADSSTLSAAIADALQPVYQQLAQLPLLQNELSQLKKQVADMKTLEQKVATLTAQLDSQAAELAQLKDASMVASRLALPTTPRVQNSPLAGPSKAVDLPNPGVAPSLLGKRHRDSTQSNITGVVEAGQEDDLDEEELAKRVVVPMKKRPKLDEEELEEPNDFLVQDDSELPDPPPRVPSFTVYTGEEEEPYVDPPPPTQALPAFYGAETSPSGSAPRRGTTTTNTQHASENQHPFSYAFVPLTSTPADLAFPTFPYPEPPQSPSPSGPAESGPSRISERTDIFAPFGLPAPGRPRSRVTSTSAPRGGDATTVDPAALTSAPGLKRTMYGTELDVDTRFGDFGLEGVATGFWAGGGGRF